MPSLRRLLLPAAAIAAVAAVPSAAHAQSGNGVTAPSYPGNTIQITDPPETLVAGTGITVGLSGHAVWNATSTDDLTIPYDLSLYVQNADVQPACAPSYSQQLQQAINLPGLNASTSPTGFVMSSSINIAPTPPSPIRDWTATSILFSIKPGVSHVTLCAYQRYVTDDVAAYGVKLNVAQPRCAFTKSKVKRGSSATFKCNAWGRMTLKMKRKGGGTTTKTVTVPTGKSTAKFSTKSLGRGSYTVAFSAGSLSLGTSHVRLT
jgi:hypothetical protein